LSKAKADGQSIKSILVINPHEPLGRLLTVDEMEGIIKFCEKNGLVLIAAEKNQNGTYDQGWKSFRHVVNKMGSKLELFSFTSISRAPFYQ
jgi:aspartate/methionine/tyrosine aminotransferase